MIRKDIVVFTGAGVSRESGIDTFRDIKDGLWYNHNVDEVATAEGLKKNPEVVFGFHNELRKGLHDKEPNSAHIDIFNLEENHNVTVVTQNVDNLHEKAGSTDVLHLHGELFKSRSVKDENTLYECLGDLNVGDLCPNGHQLRPHTVLFGEMPYNVMETAGALLETDVLIIIGCSFEIGYTLDLMSATNPEAKVYYIDPSPCTELVDYVIPEITFIKKTATEGMKEVIKLLEQDA